MLGQIENQKSNIQFCFQSNLACFAFCFCSWLLVIGVEATRHVTIKHYFPRSFVSLSSLLCLLRQVRAFSLFLLINLLWRAWLIKVSASCWITLTDAEKPKLGTYHPKGWWNSSLWWLLSILKIMSTKANNKFQLFTFGSQNIIEGLNGVLVFVARGKISLPQNPLSSLKTSRSRRQVLWSWGIIAWVMFSYINQF